MVEQHRCLRGLVLYCRLTLIDHTDFAPGVHEDSNGLWICHHLAYLESNAYDTKQYCFEDP
jgi:hypothetical protein